MKRPSHQFHQTNDYLHAFTLHGDTIQMFCVVLHFCDVFYRIHLVIDGTGYLHQPFISLAVFLRQHLYPIVQTLLGSYCCSSTNF